MHQEAMQFLARIRQILGDISKLRIVELGSFDVNGSPRALFGHCLEFTGVDRLPGPGVDVVADVRDFDGTGFDIAISTEALEHEPHPEAILTAARRALRSGGLLILTAAAPLRTPHACNGSRDLAGEYYTNIHPAALQHMLSDWADVRIEYDPRHGDVRATAYKPWGGLHRARDAGSSVPSRSQSAVPTDAKPGEAGGGPGH